MKTGKDNGSLTGGGQRDGKQKIANCKRWATKKSTAQGEGGGMLGWLKRTKIEKIVGKKKNSIWASGRERPCDAGGYYQSEKKKGGVGHATHPPDRKEKNGRLSLSKKKKRGVK